MTWTFQCDLGSSIATFLWTHTPFNQTLAALPHEYNQPCYRYMLLQTQRTWAILYCVPHASIPKLNVQLGLQYLQCQQVTGSCSSLTSYFPEENTKSYLKPLNLNVTYEFLHSSHRNVHIYEFCLYYSWQVRNFQLTDQKHKQRALNSSCFSHLNHSIFLTINSLC